MALPPSITAFPASLDACEEREEEEWRPVPIKVTGLRTKVGAVGVRPAQRSPARGGVAGGGGREAVSQPTTTVCTAAPPEPHSAQRPGRGRATAGDHRPHLE